MFTRAFISLAGSIAITAAILAGLAAMGQPTVHATPTMINGMPVTTLPAVTVTASIPESTVPTRADAQRTLTMSDAPHPLSWLIRSAATQVANSHLGMPYYSFSSSIGQAGKD